MTRRIAVFIRHADYEQLGDCPSALQPFALTPAGITQAKIAAAEMLTFLSDKKWQLQSDIDTSCLLRAWQTASIFKEVLQGVFIQPPKLDSYEALTERSVGSVANLTTAQIEQIVAIDPRFEPLPKNWKSDSHFKLPFAGAESLIEAGQRVAKHLSDKMAQLPESELPQLKLFFGHGAAFRHAAYELGVLEFDQIAALSMHHASPIYLEYCDDSSWKHIAGDWKVRAKHSEYTD